MKNLLTSIFIGCISITLISCNNTVAGAKQDIKHTSEAIKQTPNKIKKSFENKNADKVKVCSIEEEKAQEKCD